MGRSREALSNVRELHDGVSNLFLFHGGGCYGLDGRTRRALAEMGFLFHYRFFVHSRRERASHGKVAVPAMDDAQTGDVDRPVWQFGMRWLRPLHHVVPRGD
jgi:hypothetical protein